MIDIGGGASVLVDRLIERGHTDVTVLDVSTRAIGIARTRLAARAEQVRWVAADLLQWYPQRQFALWHDRAVFHFLTDPLDRARYQELATSAIRAGGHLVLATFAADGPDQCSGLPVARYSVENLAAAFSDGFATVSTRRENHTTPTGVTQAFTWLLMRRTST
ncbi:class I SAM-dependent methyltransferase [Actinokineospora sp.]|uniref:class I SAM-dependent methyltransferase n=1 Tax=Actinokineospora sp. TaxID=1872133 RepID=UPI0040376534